MFYLCVAFNYIVGYDYNKVFGANCEIVIGYVPIPLGVVGPMLMNGENIYVPMATTEVSVYFMINIHLNTHK